MTESEGSPIRSNKIKIMSMLNVSEVMLSEGMLVMCRKLAGKEFFVVFIGV